jgi:hypothetical protein
MKQLESEVFTCDFHITRAKGHFEEGAHQADIVPT